MDQDGAWHRGRPQRRQLYVRWGPSPRYPKRGRNTHPQFSAHFYYGLTAGCIKMPLGTEVGLDPGDIASDGDPTPPLQKGGTTVSPNFRPIYCGQTAGCIKMVVSTDVGLSPGNFMLDGDPALLHKKRGRSSLPNFRPISIVAKRLNASSCHLV